MIIALQALFLFRKPLINIFNQFLGPYFTNLLFNKTDDIDDDDEVEVFAEFDDEKGVVFYPPVYVQRYAAVSDCLLDRRWCGKLEKVVDFGCNDMSFIKYLKDVPGVKEILGVDLEAIPLRCSLELKCDKYSPKRDSPLKISLFQGNAADPDYRLIGCDAVVSIEMIEHMMCHDLDRFVHNIFGFIKPWVVVITTPNGDFNVLFKALETNGLRRLDHMFEWTREQFHDWCSNIVSRYPQYDVMCQGIGPGPSGTSHLGCCSQLALFFAKDYHKQPNLNINSLALVARASSTDYVSDMADSWEYPESGDEDKMLCGPDSVPSINKFLTPKKESYFTFVVDMVTSVECEDKILQCNLDTEFEKNFLFDNELGHSVVIPRKKSNYREYEIENVVNRLNCTNVPVKKFSKVTHNLMAKNKMDSLVASREVVDEIRHLSKMLNFNKNMLVKHEGTWNNINWGENAPYWNQYYKIVREYSYPFETKSEENRILELISDEIHRLVDDEDWLDGYKLEIPVEHLMDVVGHVTDDEEKVRELLEWNGYELVGDVVVYCRLVDESAALDDWLDTDTVSDWTTTDALSVSESVQEPAINDRGLRRALDQKIRNLRELCKEEDITTELDRVVCRLMKLALNPRRGSEPPPSSWLLYKLYDLLTLTENAMMRRKKHFLEESGICKMKAIDYDSEGQNVNFSARIEEDHFEKNNNLDSYQHLISNSDEDSIIEYFQERESLDNLELSTNLNQNFDGNENIEERLEDVMNDHNLFFNKEQDLEKEFVHNIPSNPVPTELQKINTININNIDQNEKVNKDISNNCNETVILNRNETIIKENKTKLKGEKLSLKYRKSKICKDITTKIPSYLNFFKYQALEYQNYMDVQNQQNYQNAMSVFSQPIPGSLMKLCQFEQREDKNIYEAVCDYHKFNDSEESRTEESMFMKIITMDGEETIAFHRTVGTDPENKFIPENDLNTEAVINVTKVESYTCYKESSIEKIESEIFLHDMNEPSTSDGIRHFSTDAQCGPDYTNYYISDIQMENKLSDIIPKPRNMGIKIQDSDINVHNKTYANIGTSTSSTNVSNKISIATVTMDKNCQLQNKSRNNLLKSDSSNPVFVEELVKPVCNVLKSKESPEMWDSSDTLLSQLKDSSNCGVQSPIIKTYDVTNNSPVIRGRSQLSYGGIYVHCFKDRQVSEDIVYQGKWQHGNNNPKVVTKKNPIIYYKKNYDFTANKKVASKQIDSYKISTKNDVHRNYKRPATVRNTKLTNTTKKSKTKIQNYTKRQPKSNELNKYIKPKTAPSKIKVSSKITTSSNRKKSSRTEINISDRNPIKTSTPVKKPVENINIFNIKNYIPPYLKKRSIYSKKQNRNVDQNFVSKFNNIVSKTFDILNLNSEGDYKNYLSNGNQINTSYLVYRNELDSEKKFCKAEPSCTVNYVPASLPRTPESYSPCSSPNSVATVRDLSFQNKIVLNPINSTCSERSSSDNFDHKNENKNRKVFRKFKNYKKANTSTGSCENKENIAVTIQNSIKEHFGKETNILRNKDTFVTEISPEKTPFINLAIGKSKVQGSAKSTNIVSGNTEYCSGSNLRINNSVTRHNNQPLVSDKSFNRRTTCHKKSDSLKAVKFTNENESIATINSIEIDMKNLIEQNLNNIESVSSNGKLIDMNHRNSDSLYSYKIEKEPSDATVVLSRDVKACNDDVELLPNRESEIYKVSTGLDDAVLTNANPDLLSLKSIASITTSKFSEYFSADNDVDEDFFSQIIDDSTVSCVHDTVDNKQNILHIEATVTSVDGIRSDTKCKLNDRVDFVNSVDSETGSHARFPGYTASEEQSLSDQSSENTFASCTIDDDIQIPYWLFESDSEPDRPVVSIPLTLTEPELDLNSDVMEPGVVGAGAGDGRGMHSDVSHESSGHGSTTSSSGSSSEMESQETLSDGPQEPEGSDQLLVVEIQDVAATLPDQLLNTAPATHEESRDAHSAPRRNIYPLVIVSDGDADVSSLDTDAVNSDNN